VLVATDIAARVSALQPRREFRVPAMPEDYITIG
jgi:hypothetical protein